VNNNSAWDDMIAFAVQHGANETVAGVARYIGFYMKIKW
jgi:hypothetical protein